MTNYDDLLREKEDGDQFNDHLMDKHWAALEKKFDAPIHQPSKYRSLVRAAVAIAAVLLVFVLGYVFFKGKEQDQHQNKIMLAAEIKSAIRPPLNGTNVPYEKFSFNAETGDTLFTQNGSIIIFPKNAVLNSKGEIVTGNIEIKSREFNDPFDYSIAGIPMDYDSAGVKYMFISSGMIDINAYQNGELLQVNPAAKPQLNLVSTNKERQTSLYQLDTLSGKWINKGMDEVNQVQIKNTKPTDVPQSEFALIEEEVANDYVEKEVSVMPKPPRKASAENPTINVSIDPASFKELLVYDGLKFEVTDTKADKLEEDSKTEWQHIELIRGAVDGTYKVEFTAGSKKVVYNVKPVLEGKDFVAAEKLYQEKLQEYNKIKTERQNVDIAKKKSFSQQRDSVEKEIREENKRIKELNKLVAIRNTYIEAENKKILAINKENERRRDSARSVRQKEQATWDQATRVYNLERNLIRSFEIDGFGYWNCDQPTLPATQFYTGTFTNKKHEVVVYNTLCIATEGVNRIQYYNNSRNIGLVPNSSYFGWAFNNNQFYYFTKTNYKYATKTENPNTISIPMTQYDGDITDYSALKRYIMDVNSKMDISKK